MKKCSNCEYGHRNELADIVCVNSDSANCCEFQSEGNHCLQWVKSKTVVLHDGESK